MECLIDKPAVGATIRYLGGDKFSNLPVGATGVVLRVEDRLEGLHGYWRAYTDYEPQKLGGDRLEPAMSAFKLGYCEVVE